MRPAGCPVCVILLSFIVGGIISGQLTYYLCRPDEYLDKSMGDSELKARIQALEEENSGLKTGSSEGSESKPTGSWLSTKSIVAATIGVISASALYYFGGWFGAGKSSATLDKCKTDLSDKRQEVSTLTDEVSGLQGRLDTKKTANDGLGSDLAKCKAGSTNKCDYQSRIDEVSNCNAAHNKSKGELQTMENERDRLEKENTKYEKENERIDTLKATIEQLKNKCQNN